MQPTQLQSGLQPSVPQAPVQQTQGQSPNSLCGPLPLVQPPYQRQVYNPGMIVCFSSRFHLIRPS